MIIVLTIIGLLALFLLAVILSGIYFSEKPYHGPKSDHFDGKYFHNPDKVQAKGLRDVIKWSADRKRGKWIENYETSIRTVPIEPSPEKGVHVTFINHSTFLIQINGKNILTDPVWSKRVSPLTWAGPKRMRPPGIRFEDLPPIDLVLLTHNHYDHLDLPTLIKLEKKFTPQFVVPLGVKAMLDKRNFNKIIEMDWWEEIEWEGMKFQPTPANHFSGRGTLDRNRTLWCGYLINSGEMKILFVGDTGYGDTFKRIEEKVKEIDLAFIPIGAYLPRWFMSPIHVSPDEAVQIHNDIKSRQSIAMHFGTFPLADEGQGIPEKDLNEYLDQSQIPQDQFIIPKEGETLKFI